MHKGLFSSFNSFTLRCYDSELYLWVNDDYALINRARELQGELLYGKAETRDLIGQCEVRPKQYGPPKSRMDLKFSNY